MSTSTTPRRGGLLARLDQRPLPPSAAPAPLPAAGPILARLEQLASENPPLAAALAEIGQKVRGAQHPALDADTRHRHALDAIAMLVKVVAYDQEQRAWRDAAERARWEAGR
jgi:hypothetical protein